MSMTVEEAIRRLKDHFRVHDDGRPTPYLDEAVSMAIQALEKQKELRENCEGKCSDCKYRGEYQCANDLLIEEGE